MPRFPMAALAAALLAIPVLSAACGGSDNNAKATTTDGGGAPAATPTVEPGKEGLAQPTIEDRVLPTPTKVPDDGVVFTIVAGKTTLTPKPADISGYATTRLTAGGKDYTGITVQTLGEKVSAKPESLVTIQGVRSDGKRAGFLRGLLKDVGSSTLLVPDGAGHLNLVSSASDPDQWITSVISVTFQ